jgi:hypothetical protein
VWLLTGVGNMFRIVPIEVEWEAELLRNDPKGAAWLEKRKVNKDGRK